MAPVVQQPEGGKGRVGGGLEAQDAVPQVAPAALVQQHHLQTRTGTAAARHLPEPEPATPGPTCMM